MRRTSRLPCARGGGFAPAKPEGLFRAAKRGRANPFAPAVNPSVSLSADSSPYTGEPREIHRLKSYLITPVGLHRGAGAERVYTTYDPSQLKFLLPPFLLQRKGGDCFSFFPRSKSGVPQRRKHTRPITRAIRVFLLPAFLFFQRKRDKAHKLTAADSPCH